MYFSFISFSVLCLMPNQPLRVMQCLRHTCKGAHHYYYKVVLASLSSLTLSASVSLSNPSLLCIALGRSSWSHVMSAQSWCNWIFAGQLARHIQVHKGISLMSVREDHSWDRSCFFSSVLHVLFVLLGWSVLYRSLYRSLYWSQIELTEKELNEKHMRMKKF